MHSIYLNNIGAKILGNIVQCMCAHACGGADGPVSGAARVKLLVKVEM